MATASGLLAQGGQSAALIRSHDWAETSLGPVETWPAALLDAVSLMLAAGAQIVLFWGPDYVALYNDAYAPTIGDKHPDALGRPASESWSELWDDLAPLLDRVRLTGETVRAKDRPFHIRRHGFDETVYFDISYSAVRLPDGSVGGVLCIVSETTATVRAQRRQEFQLGLNDALRDVADPHAIMATAAAHLGRYLGVDRCGYGEIDPVGKTISVAADWTDGAVPSVVGRHPLDGFGASLSAPLLKAGRKVAMLFVHHSAPRHWLDEDRALLGDVAERVWAAVERARAEASLRELNETLEARVQERTAEVADTLRQLRAEIAERARIEGTLRQMQRLEAVGQLTAGVAHDFNNLLTIVLGNITFLERALEQSGIDGQMLGRVATMREAAERGATLTAQLLAFSRQQLLEARTVDLNATIEAMRDLVRSSLGTRMRLQAVPQTGLWPALVDPAQVELAILNLAINARDAMQEAGDESGTITVATENASLGDPIWLEDPPAGDYVMVSVADTGTGMAPDVLAKAFEPFFTTKPIGKGSGLGLAQVFGFARQSGGGVKIQTRVGAGTTVMMFLPRAPQAEATTADSDPAADFGGTPRNRVLLVDDDEFVREITGMLLEDIGCEVVEAGNGATALEAVAGDDFDLMVVDFAMPGMNGAEVARLARQHRPALKVLFVTGYADHAATQAIGEENIVMKPFQDGQLEARVRRMLAYQPHT
jgi:signal transduction histidine kinase